MDKEMRNRFWKDFIIPIQEESTDVAYANPADVSRSLVRARNWYGTISENILEAVANIDTANATLKDLENKQDQLVQVIIAGAMRADGGKSLPTSVVKTKQTLGIYARSKCEIDEEVLMDEIIAKQHEVEAYRSFWQTERAKAEIMRRALEKTTDWLVQYINWHKFELREQV